MKLFSADIAAYLEFQYDKFNRPEFIDTDPISIPHRYHVQADREISGLLTATISWGNRKSILKNANRLMELMDDAPLQFILSAGPAELKRLNEFVHRTFNGTDAIAYIRGLRKIYNEFDSLEVIFAEGLHSTGEMGISIHRFRNRMISGMRSKRTHKHIADPLAGSAAKRINMFLRWMVRKDKRGVDFGIWKQIPVNALMCPLDVHSGNVARHLGLLHRAQNDWKAVEELTAALREFDAVDPVRFDFALYGAGVNKDI